MEEIHLRIFLLLSNPNSSNFDASHVPYGGGQTRLELAISKERNNSGGYSVYAVRTDNNLLSMHALARQRIELDRNLSENQVRPMNLIFTKNQGYYNTVIGVNPTDPEEIYIGGIDIWRWNQTVDITPI